MVIIQPGSHHYATDFHVQVEVSFEHVEEGEKSQFKRILKSENAFQILAEISSRIPRNKLPVSNLNFLVSFWLNETEMIELDQRLYSISYPALITSAKKSGKYYIFHPFHWFYDRPDKIDYSDGYVYWHIAFTAKNTDTAPAILMIPFDDYRRAISRFEYQFLDLVKWHKRSYGEHSGDAMDLFAPIPGNIINIQLDNYEDWIHASG